MRRDNTRCVFFPIRTESCVPTRQHRRLPQGARLVAMKVRMNARNIICIRSVFAHSLRVNRLRMRRDVVLK